ncbi:hypothetical protein [Anaeromassilibacillus senegalensis]|uniref:hypothetical protein n=1 Tax=Anaeromassilibacillus senegalensis TaxID=1673717 RepID=UPI0012B5B602|nr:hypothetical protein [Anaeromassilibacillus senegalensis]
MIGIAYENGTGKIVALYEGKDWNDVCDQWDKDDDHNDPEIYALSATLRITSRLTLHL